MEFASKEESNKSAFASALNDRKAGWSGAVSSDEDEDEEVAAEPANEIEESSDDSDESSDIDEEEYSSNLQAAASVSYSAPTTKQPTKPVQQNLSKKERELLRKKELEDLDTLLGEMGVAPVSESAPTEGASTGMHALYLYM